jgi:multisubunit Na+/H+ antiporter MnhG subunit
MSSTNVGSDVQQPATGAAAAAVLAAAIGSATLGLFVLLGATGVYSAPALYGPAGGLSTRSTLAVVAWLVAWAVLHLRWRGRSVALERVAGWSLALITAGVLATFPPLWALLK